MGFRRFTALRRRREGGRLVVITAFALLAAACGSNGGGGPLAPQPQPPPAQPGPTVPQTPPSSAPPSANTAEFRASTPAYDQVNALAAFEAGNFGEGVLVSVIDTGIDADSPEFEGRIDPRSADLAAGTRAGGASLSDEDRHGNAVAALVGAAKNDSGMHGIAPESDLLIFRTDDDGDDDLSIVGSALAEGVQLSAQFGARVLNLSLGSNEAGARVQFAGYFNTTADADIVSVIAAGNDRLSGPDQSARAALDARGTAIIAGSVDANNQISSFSNRAGPAAEVFLVAPGERLAVPSPGATDGRVSTFSGTSAAAPVIAGAAALIRGRWPNLTAAETVDILLTTATDLGAPGVDATYGRGLLNIEAALSPVGGVAASTASGDRLAVNPGAAVVSPAFGFAPASVAEIVVLDAFNRDFAFDLNNAVGWRASLAADPFGLMRPDLAIETATSRIGGADVRFRLETQDFAQTDPAALARGRSVDPFANDIGDLNRDRGQRLSLMARQRLSGNASLMFAQGFSPREADAAAITRTPMHAGMSRDGFADAFLAEGEAGLAALFQLKGFLGADVDVLLASAENLVNPLSMQNEFTSDSAFGGAFGLGGVDGFGGFGARPSRVANARIGLGWTRGTDVLSLQAGVRAEDGGVFGASFGGLLGDVARSNTYYQSLGADVGLARGWRASARGGVGVSEVEMAGGGLNSGLGGAVEGMVSTQFAAALYRRSMFLPGDKLSFAVVQPLRIEAGAMRFLAATGFDPLTEELSFSEQRLAFGAGPRAVDFEGRYQLFGARGGFVEAGLLYQLNAVAAADGQATGAVTGLLRAGGRF